MVGFPTTFRQAKLLEEALTGYVPEEERLNDMAEKLKKKVQELVSPTQQQQSTQLRKSGVDIFLSLNSTVEEAQRRKELRKVDPATETVYSLEENPPPTDVKGLAERLQPVNDPAENEE